MEMDAKACGELIARRRKELGLSQGELAARLHVTDKAVSKWETGRGLPGIDSLEPLADELGLSVSELLSGKQLTPEELPKEAGGQIVESLRKGKRRIIQGAGAMLAAGLLAVGAWAGVHYFSTVPETDTAALERQAAAYLGRFEDTSRSFDYDALQIVETERRGGYLAALCTDGAGNWCMCVYDRDSLFPDRWRANGGTTGMEAGELGSWNFGNPQEAVIIFCGGELPEEAAWYTFCNSGITYTCPIEERRVLDVFLLPDTSDISSYPEQLLDENGQIVDGKTGNPASAEP
jgi:transcriptional regulator with XRE-family HTH domain